MKQCDRGLSPFAPPFAIASSSSLPFAAPESDPEDSFWSDFTFDFSFLTSDDQKNGLDDDVSLPNSSSHADSTIGSKAVNALGTNGDFAGPVNHHRFDLKIKSGGNSDSFLNLPNFLDSDLKCVDSKPRISPSLAVVSTSHFDSNVTMVEEGRPQHFPPTASVLGVTSITPLAKNAAVANDNSGDDEAEGRFPCASMDRSACSGKFLISESHCSPLFSNGSGMEELNLLSANRTVLFEKSSIPSDQDDTEVDSPCWRGTRSHSTAVSGTKSLSFRRSSDDLNGLYGLNPLAPQFIPSSAKKNLDKNGMELEENSSSSLKRSLSSTFPPSSEEFSISDPCQTGIEQDYGVMNRIGILIHDADESLGLVSQDTVSEAMSILNISNQFQTSKRLDPLAPVFVPIGAKRSAVVHEKHGIADHIIAIETNARSTYRLSSSDEMLLNNVKVETHSSEVDHGLRNRYSNSVHESGTTYSFNPRLGSQVQISEKTKLDSSSNKKKLNPLAPQFSLADTKLKVYGCEKNHASNDLLLPMVNSSVLFSPIGYSNHKELHANLAQSSVHMEPSFNEVDTEQMGRLPPNILHGNSSLKSFVYQPTKVGDNFVSTKKLVVEPKTILTMRDDNDFEHPLPFHILETAVRSSPGDVKALSDFGLRHGCSTSASSPSPKMNVKKLLTTIHGLSELLIHVHGSESSDSPNEQDLDLINSTVQNLNSYSNSRVQEHTGNYSSAVHSSCDLKSLPNMRKRSIRDHQLPKAQNMTHSMVSGETVPDSHFAYGVTRENGFGKGVGNHQTEQQINPQMFFYRSLWLKAEADRSLMEYKSYLLKTRNLSN